MTLIADLIQKQPGILWILRIAREVQTRSDVVFLPGQRSCELNDVLSNSPTKNCHTPIEAGAYIECKQQLQRIEDILCHWSEELNTISNMLLQETVWIFSHQRQEDKTDSLPPSFIFEILVLFVGPRDFSGYACELFVYHFLFNTCSMYTNQFNNLLSSGWVRGHRSSGRLVSTITMISRSCNQRSKNLQNILNYVIKKINITHSYQGRNQKYH